jgi:hypothetical protein
MNKRYLYLFGVLLAAAFLTGYASQSYEQVANLPGFLHGLLHGFIILFSFIISLFTDFEIYEFPNNGGWYDFGFLLGAMMFFGGGGAGSRSRKR